MTDDDRRPTFEEVASSGGHKDATMHVGGHGEPWPDVKVLAITSAGQTYVCVRRDGSEMVTPVSSVRAGLETFASELQAVIRAVADAEDRNRKNPPTSGM